MVHFRALSKSNMLIVSEQILVKIWSEEIIFEHFLLVGRIVSRFQQSEQASPNSLPLPSLLTTLDLFYITIERTTTLLGNRYVAASGHLIKHRYPALNQNKN